MRRFCFPALAACVLILAACVRKEPDEPPEITLFPPQAYEQRTEPQTSKRVSANDTFGEAHTFIEPETASVLDTSDLFRTADSYRFESTAAAAARQRYRDSVPLPQTLRVTDMNVWDCADDGSAVYYSFYIDAVYAIQSGERIERGEFFDIGVRKDSGEVFDAREQMPQVLQAYSLFLPKETEIERAEHSEQDALQGAIRALLKSPQTEVISCTPDPVREHVFTVLCSGVNDYGISIRETRDLDLLPQEDGYLVRTAAETS